jgi:hypothetical protein
LRLERHKASEPSLGECLVPKGDKSVISSMTHRSIRLQIRVIGKPVTRLDMGPVFFPYSI